MSEETPETPETPAPETPETPATPAPETPETPVTPEPKPEASETVDLKQTLSELRDIMRAPASTVTPEQREAQIAKLEQETGFTRQQLLAQDRLARNAALGQTLEMGKELGRMKAEKELGAYAPELLKEVEVELSKMAPEYQANPTVWINTANFIKGKNLDKILAKHKPRTEPSTVVTGGPVTPTRSSSGGGKPPAKKYDSNEQEMINRYFRGNAEAYEAAKNKKSVTDDNQIRSKPGAVVSAADAALAAMTENNS